eukprot:TRINITY_DN743_c0_g1_i11.p1 TRINITY_DN743_c0_g1~~TRINITY_DN743_c0_g1_i11.p1  ORF type:complete len:277 (+),score=44.21 TRINITY_DN743_c0_g1_i11:83-832(+)
MARVLSAPVVNYLDMPEAASGGRSRSRQGGYRSDRSKFRVKSLALPVVAENDVQQADTLLVADCDVQSWTCAGCTFINSGWLPRCELCETPRDRSVGAIATSRGSSQNESFSIQEQDQWPSLKESADEEGSFEVASVASSWLEVDDDVKVLGDSDDGEEPGEAAVETSASQGSWASKAKVVAARGPAASLPASGVIAPPIHKAKPPSTSKIHDADVSQNEVDDLTLLEDRRLNPQFDRGSRQRRCDAKR